MDRFKTLTGTACPLRLENIDTDQLIPARFMSRPRAVGYGNYLLHDARTDETGAIHGRFILDNPRYVGASILIAKRNFGTGSSREAAVYALWDYGIRCVIAPSFGDIFASNATKNGLLLATVTEAVGETLLNDAIATMTVDLDAQTITSGKAQHSFVIDPARRQQLLNGWDDLDMTLCHTADIQLFRETRLKHQPWAFV
jgi:3-isopropylmalate/(R)-2-methylmalate dehydratase small subunit